MLCHLALVWDIETSIDENLGRKNKSMPVCTLYGFSNRQTNCNPTGSDQLYIIKKKKQELPRAGIGVVIKWNVIFASMWVICQTIKGVLAHSCNMLQYVGLRCTQQKKKRGSHRSHSANMHRNAIISIPTLPVCSQPCQLEGNQCSN